MSIREVLVATDFSEIADEAVRAARQHAERFGARLHLLHVLEAGNDDAAERLARASEGSGATVPVLAVPLGASQSRQVDQPLLPPSFSPCLVCREPSPDLICHPCRARIRGEALRREQEDERAGRTPR